MKSIWTISTDFPEVRLKLVVMAMVWIVGVSFARAASVVPTLRWADAPVVSAPSNVDVEIQKEDPASDASIVSESLTLRSRWFRIRAAERGRYYLKLVPEASDTRGLFNMVFEVQPSPDSPRLVAAGGPCVITNSNSVSVTFPVEPAGEYLVGTDVFTNQFTGGESKRRLSFEISFVPAPANDEFESAMELAGDRRRVSADMRGATIQKDENRLRSDSPGATVWYRWTAPTNGWLEVTEPVTRGFQAVRSWTNPPLWIDRNDLMTVGLGLLMNDYWLPRGYAGGGSYGSGSASFQLTTTFDWIAGCSVFRPVFGITSSDRVDSVQWLAMGSELGIRVEAGITYRIAVDAMDRELGEATFVASFTAGPSNDLFDHRTVLNGFSASGEGHTAGATLTAGEPQNGFTTNNPTVVWWAWTAPAEGPVSVEVASPGRRTRVSVWAGDSVDWLQVIGLPVIDPIIRREDTVHFYAWPGRSYAVAVSILDSDSEAEVFWGKPASYSLAIRQMPARLRPVTVGAGGLIFSDPKPGWVVVQDSVATTRWMFRGILNPAQPAADSGILRGWFVADSTGDDPAASGLYRVWLLDVPAMPEPRILGVQWVGVERQQLQLAVERVPGDKVEVEKSTDLSIWETLGTLQPGDGNTVRDPNAPFGRCFYRVKSIRVEVERLVVPTPLRP